MKEAVAERCGVDYISLEQIKDKADYQCGIGTIIEDSKGVAHQILHGGVAIHPNDAGMAFIADAVIAALEE